MESISFLESLDFMKRNMDVYVLLHNKYVKVELKDKTCIIHCENTFKDLFEAEWFIK